MTSSQLVGRAPDTAPSLPEYRSQLHAWLDANQDVLAPQYAAPGTLDDHVAQM